MEDDKKTAVEETAENKAVESTQANADPEADTTGTEKIFTQDDMNQKCAKAAGKAERAILRKLNLESMDDLQPFIEGLKNNKPDGEQAGSENLDSEYKEKYEQANSELQGLKRQLTLKAHGVPEDDLDYYAFKVEKSMEEGQDFEEAAESYFKEHPVRIAKVSTAAPMESHGRTYTKQEIMAVTDTKKRQALIASNPELFM